MPSSVHKQVYGCWNDQTNARQVESMSRINSFRLLACLRTVGGKRELAKVRFEIGWHLTFRMKVNIVAQQIAASRSSMLINDETHIGT